jgi:release factor glutamine methyltransferase
VKVDHGIDIDLLPEVYNPSDDSYLLLGTADPSPGEAFLEMGTGSGLVALHAAKLGAKVTAVDINPHAVQCARSNAFKNNLKVNAFVSDLFANVAGLYDIIVFNPPYLPDEGEPASWMERSWAGGSDGTDVVVRFLQEAWKYLLPRGRIFIILSSFGSMRTVLREAKQRYHAEMMEEKHMFFESIFAYKLTMKSSRTENIGE